MARTDPKILYSCGTQIAYQINKNYYNDTHYVWCTSRFGSPGISEAFSLNPASSDSYSLYQEYKKSSGMGDWPADAHSSIIKQHRVGLKKGAGSKLNDGIITLAEHGDIHTLVDMIPLSDFAPLIYTMGFSDVKRMAKKVPIGDRAHPLSDEWIIEALPRTHFDIVRF